jgi:hypothetical protein
MFLEADLGTEASATCCFDRCLLLRVRSPPPYPIRQARGLLGRAAVAKNPARVGASRRFAAHVKLIGGGKRVFHY